MNKVKAPKFVRMMVVLSTVLAGGLWFVNSCDSKVEPLAGGALPQLRSPEVDYAINPANERFFVWTPPNYDGSQRFGLIVYISSIESVESLPPGWEDVLVGRRYIFIAPQQAGNNCSQQSRRCGLAVAAAMAMQRKYQIDPRFIYAAGISGGARTASDLGFHQPDVFKGTIQSCGSDFYRKVAGKEAKSWVDTAGYPYGVVKTTAEEVSRAKASTKFCLITGAGDFRRGNILDIYNDGFAREGFKARLFDVPTLGHQDCDAATLSRALDFLER
jgi:hypothetical protein